MELKLDFPSVQTRHTDEEIEKISLAIKNAKSLSMGELIKDFENDFSNFLNVKYSFGVSSATSALEIAAILSGAKKGDEILIPAHTYTASALPFLRLNAKLVFIDIDPETFVMDVEDLKRKITSKSKVIVAPHLYGLPINMDSLMKIAKEYNLFVIEDCAQSPAAEFNNKMVGTFGDVGCFSFHSQKNITALGEGGMLVTNNESYANSISSLRIIGHAPFNNNQKYWIPAMSNIIETIPGKFPGNYKMGEINAFAAHLLLKRIKEINKSRQNYFNYISEQLKDFAELRFQFIPENCKSAYHLLPAFFDGNNINKNNHDLINDLFEIYGIKCVVQYYPLYRYDLFVKNGYNEELNSCPNTNKFYDNMISFPFKSQMTNYELSYLINSIKELLLLYRKSK